jgi:hypothetical protein
MGTQIGIADGRPLLFCRKASKQFRIGLELWRSSGELPCMTQYHARASMHRLNQSPDMNICVAVSVQFAHVCTVLCEADNGEAAGVIGNLRRADIEECRPIIKLIYVIDMSGNANVFVERLRGRFGRQAELVFSAEGNRRAQHEDQRDSPHASIVSGESTQLTPITQKRKAGSFRHWLFQPRQA